MVAVDISITEALQCLNLLLYLQRNAHQTCTSRQVDHNLSNLTAAFTSIFTGFIPISLVSPWFLYYQMLSRTRYCLFLYKCHMFWFNAALVMSHATAILQSLDFTKYVTKLNGFSDIKQPLCQLVEYYSCIPVGNQQSPKSDDLYIHQTNFLYPCQCIQLCMLIP